MNQDKLRHLVDYLYEKNLDEHIKLPEIAVMGDTSSGKSSLLSALSEVQLPSASELTTRCPTRLHLEGTNDGTISASVGIKWHQSSAYSAEFQTRNFTGADAFKQIPVAITEAQAFIISKSCTPVAFDVVEVELKKPNSFDVTLIDLPGFVRSVGKGEDPRIVNDIKQLCKEYLDKPRCIILAVIPANVDFHNSQIMADALEVDPSTCRTIPIITKPDLIDEGAEGGVVDLLLGRKTHDFSLGFHIVKCRGQRALDDGMDILGGVEDEKRFFRSTTPWKNISDKSIMGVDNLGAKLADVQITMMSNAVPKMIQEVTLLRNEAEKSLQALGIDANSSDTVRRRIFSYFVEKLKSESRDNIQGTGTGIGNDLWRTSKGFTFRAHIQSLKKKFADDILKGRLNHICTIKEGSKVTVTCPKTRANCQGIVHKMEKGYCLVESNDPFNIICFDKAINCEYPNGIVGKKVNYLNSNKQAMISAVIENSTCSVNSFKEIKFMNVKADFSWLSDLILKNTSRNLQVFLNADVFNSIVADFIKQDWLPLCQSLLDNISTAVTQLISSILEKIQSPHFLEFNRWVKNTIDKLFNNLKELTLLQLNHIIEGEFHPYTNNHYLFEIINKERNKPLRDAIKALSTDDTGTVSLAAVEALIERNERMSCEDHVLREMEITLDAYGKVAAKCAIDLFPKQIDKHLLDPLENTIHESLQRTDAELKVLFSENQQTVRKRQKLTHTVETMKATEIAIQTFLNKSF
eukprot:gene11923-24975_t